jgi:hypothetical protein
MVYKLFNNVPTSLALEVLMKVPSRQSGQYMVYEKLGAPKVA